MKWWLGILKVNGDDVGKGFVYSTHIGAVQTLMLRIMKNLMKNNFSMKC